MDFASLRDMLDRRFDRLEDQIGTRGQAMDTGFKELKFRIDIIQKDYVAMDER